MSWGYLLGCIVGCGVVDSCGRSGGYRLCGWPATRDGNCLVGEFDYPPQLWAGQAVYCYTAFGRSLCLELDGTGVCAIGAVDSASSSDDENKLSSRLL